MLSQKIKICINLKGNLKSYKSRRIIINLITRVQLKRVMLIIRVILIR
jgi:hypothetical protein